MNGEYKGRSYEWLHQRDTGKTHRACGGKIVHEKQVNAQRTGICDYRNRCVKCDIELFDKLLKYQDDDFEERLEQNPPPC